eukprot:TRINITY_DN33384_c0_g1_i1.p1 TRINITY_DN33384_c0_g1~~TRINITY_DN33384_c0_g1_i1.p1  ORF type:complete len:131 (+),score=37.33 TRINITY_DN33384_c0_g1_i1:24-395(+)
MCIRDRYQRRVHGWSFQIYIFKKEKEYQMPKPAYSLPLKNSNANNRKPHEHILKKFIKNLTNQAQKIQKNSKQIQKSKKKSKYFLKNQQKQSQLYQQEKAISIKEKQFSKISSEKKKNKIRSL